MEIFQATSIEHAAILLGACLAAYICLQARRLRSLEKFVQQQGRGLEETRSEIAALLKCEQGIGQRLKLQQAQVREVVERQDKLEISDGSSTSYRQALVLLNKGASTDELFDACDLSRGELELLNHLKSLTPTVREDRAA